MSLSQLQMPPPTRPPISKRQPSSSRPVSERPSAIPEPGSDPDHRDPSAQPNRTTPHRPTTALAPHRSAQKPRPRKSALIELINFLDPNSERLTSQRDRLSSDIKETPE